jgi:Ca2+/Na+ antiporter
MKNFQVMTFNAMVLIALGVFGYVTSGSPTALIAPAIGIILLGIAIPVKKDNSVAAHIGVGVTALTAIMFFVVGAMRGNVIIIIMAVVSLIALIFYVSDFMKRKKEREENTTQE